MVHLSPLPGSPRFGGSFRAVVDDARQRASQLAGAGFRCVMVENFGDTPFHPGRVPPETVAAMTACIDAVRHETGIVVGANVLRNDAHSAIAIAAIVEAAMIRVNVLAGMMFTDQGPLVGKADTVLRARSRLAPDVRIWADVMVKHATPPAGLTLRQAASDLWQRGGADALIVSGSGTGTAPDREDYQTVRDQVPAAPIVAGSGASTENLTDLEKAVDYVIVGTDLEEDRVPGAALDPDRLRKFTAKARDCGLL